MRVIKFRAWNSQTGEMLEDVGLIPNNKDFQVIISGDGIYINPSTPGHRVLMQFTGLHDKNGKEIYEGDVVIGKTRQLPKIVEYIGACFHLVNINKIGIRHYALSRSSAKCMSIIGNIFSNPELIKQ